LDPAGPTFSIPNPNNRLDVTDAKFVDVIHTSAGKSGIAQSIGHVDFYPNGETTLLTFLENLMYVGSW
jgi:hypothetical protein